MSKELHNTLKNIGDKLPPTLIYLDCLLACKHHFAVNFEEARKMVGNKTGNEIVALFN